MSAELHLILNVAIAVGVALIGGLLAHRLHQPVIVGYLLAGVVLGPFTPGFVGDHAQISALAEIGVIFLMFALGIEFSLKELARVRNVAIFGTAIQIVLLILAGLGMGWMLGWPFAQSLFFGGIISISSTMVILKTLMDRGEVTAHHGRATAAGVEPGTPSKRPRATWATWATWAASRTSTTRAKPPPAKSGAPSALMLIHILIR